MTADPPHAAETLVSLCPVVFRSHWATLIDVSDGAPRPSFSTTLAPDLTPEIAAKFTPFDATHRTDLEADWSPGWGDTTAVVTPLTRRPGDRHRPLGWTRLSRLRDRPTASSGRAREVGASLRLRYGRPVDSIRVG